jgi:hypothetical protein
MPTDYDYMDEGEEEETLALADDHTPPPPPPARLHLPVLPDREARLISIEQEIGGGAEYIATAFHHAGLSNYRDMLGYHSSAGRGFSPGFCHVEEDGSVNGEIIYGKLRLQDNAIAARLEEALMLVRSKIAEGEARLDMRCGMHIHVDGKGLGMHAVESLYHLWNHLEDTIYRMGAAHWRAHRTAIADYNYAPATTKGLMSRAEIGSFFDGHRGGLNLQNYLGARGNCSCGAFDFASWEDCTCDLRKATVEFRVFNATANLRKVHAYTALSLAMVEASKRLTVTPEDFEPFNFDRTSKTPNEAQTLKALGFIFETLPLTETEREDLAYCARNSQVADTFATYSG